MSKCEGCRERLWNLKALQLTRSATRITSPCLTLRRGASGHCERKRGISERGGKANRFLNRVLILFDCESLKLRDSRAAKPLPRPKQPTASSSMWTKPKAHLKKLELSISIIMLKYNCLNHDRVAIVCRAASLRLAFLRTDLGPLSGSARSALSSRIFPRAPHNTGTPVGEAGERPQAQPGEDSHADQGDDDQGRDESRKKKLCDWFRSIGLQLPKEGTNRRDRYLAVAESPSLNRRERPPEPLRGLQARIPR